jgi:hypothetical protein
MITLRTTITLVACFSLPGALSAQALGRDSSMALLSARLEAMRADPALPDSLRRLSVKELIAPANTGYTRWLDDAGAQLYMQSIATLTRQVPADRCGRMLDPSAGDGTDLDVMLIYADSAAVGAWATVLERIVRARATGQAGGRAATPAELQTSITSAIGRLSVEDQTRLITIARNPPPTPEDACWTVQQIMSALAALPPQALGPVVRAMFGPTAPVR